jgi:hypothetical protein
MLKAWDEMTCIHNEGLGLGNQQHKEIDLESACMCIKTPAMVHESSTSARYQRQAA